MAERCAATTKAGHPRKATARAGSAYCLFHDPDAAEERRAASRKGGANKANAVRAERRMVNYTVPHVRVVLSTAMNEVFEGRMDIGLAAALATLGRAVILANEKSDMEARLAELERRAGIVTDEGAG